MIKIEQIFKAICGYWQYEMNEKDAKYEFAPNEIEEKYLKKREKININHKKEENHYETITNPENKNDDKMQRLWMFGI